MLGLLEVLGLNTPQPQVLVKKGKQTAEHLGSTLVLSRSTKKQSRHYDQFHLFVSCSNNRK